MASALLCVSCLEETMPTDAVTQDVVDASYNTTEAMLKALPARFNVDGSASGHYAFGYGTIMHVRDVQTADMYVVEHDYDQFRAWEQNTNLGANSGYMQYIWNYYYQSIRTCNNLLASVPDHERATDLQKAAVGAAYAFRALYYLDLARQYEFLPCEVFPAAVNGQGNNIDGLTVPITTESTTELSAQNTPRATRDQMAQFIAADLDSAEKYIEYLDNDQQYVNDRSMPHLYSVFGLKARLYMWTGDYRLAYDNARNAVLKGKAGGVYHAVENVYSDLYGMDINGDGAADCYTGFVNPYTFMWASVQTSDNATVQSGIVNWTSWMSPFTSYGYAHNGPMSCIDKNLYKQIGVNDWRRNLFLVGNDNYPEGMATKFFVGGGDFDVPSVSAATAYPIMRIEEMDLIAAEAAAHVNVAQGLTMLNAYMQEYCDDTYRYSGERTAEAIIEEIVKQKRIELWGEGQSFFDYKRLDMDVVRGYEGTNFAPLTRFNTKGRPAWMNWVIVMNEENTNKAVANYNNPDHSGKCPLWIEN